MEVIRPGGDPAWKTTLCRWWNLIVSFINRLLRVFKIKPPTLVCFPRVPMPKFTDIVYEVETGAQVVVRGVLFEGLGSGAAFIRIRNKGVLEQGSRYPFEVQQLVNGYPVGGSTYFVVIEGERKLPPPLGFRFVMEGREPSDWDRIEREAKEHRYLPPWAADIVRDREAETKK
jgi:hypothetical protein